MSARTPAVQVHRFFEFALLGMLASGYLAVVGSGYLDLPTVILAGMGLVLRGLLVTGTVRLSFSPRLVTAATLLYIGFYPLDYLFLSGDFLRATVHMVFFVAVMKVLTAHTSRDYTFVKIIAVLELLAAALLSAGLSFLIFLALFLLFAIATFASGEVRRATLQPLLVVRGGLKAFPLRLSTLAVILFAGILSLTAGLFFLLPRTARAAFQHLVSERYHLPGFANEVSLGDIGEIKQMSSTVMRVRMLDDEPPPAVKWRGSALSRFDGRRWYNPPAAEEPLVVEKKLVRLVESRPRGSIGRGLSYQVHVKDLASETLFFAGTPETLSINVKFIYRGPGSTYRTSFGGPNGVLYNAYAFLEDEDAPRPEPPVLPIAEREANLQLPVIDSRIPKLSREMAGPGMDLDRARTIERRLRAEFGYTLELPSEPPADPLAWFLFERKKGHCEYFASAMAVMLRNLGIPARVVTGFQSGIFNPISGWQLIRASDAHSWVEAWIDRRGWITFDPTPPDPGSGGNAFLSRLALYFDAAEVFWQEWVLNYDLERQLTLASRMEESGRWLRLRWLENTMRSFTAGAKAAIRAWGAVLTAIAALIVLAVFLGPYIRKWWEAKLRVRRLQRGQGAAEDATILYLRMLAVLRARGIEKPGWLTPWEFVRVMPACEISPLVEDLTVAYNEMRFGGSSSAAPRMIEILGQIEKAR